ncbi:MAG TPA: RNA 2',3'-cyclic phosphodiesterase [Telluria sp.]|jgi:2'-5' RNA ligase|nr:RNA 2',3'-cyclic phosphodiesterase [Telluria sp.]
MDARLFVALWPEPAVRTQLAARRDRWHWTGGATPVATNRLHLTLHFIGNLAVSRIEEVGAALQLPFTPFTLRLGRDVLWPHGVAVLEPLQPPDALIALQRGLDERLRTLAIDTDARSYKPHVTLARRAGATPVPAEGDAIEWQVGHYALMRSQPGYYEVLRAYPA